MRALITAFLFFAVVATAQQIGQNAQSGNNPPSKIVVSTQMVVETVVVKDKNGSPVKSLTAKDFTLTEDGVAQAIRFCDAQEMPDTPGAAPVAPLPVENIKTYDRLARTQIAPETPGNVRYKDHRLLALYFDMTAMPSGDQLRALT